MNTSPESGSEELGAEADAEDWNAPVECGADDLDFVEQVRMAIALIDVHGAAEHDEACVAGDLHLRGGMAREVDVADAQTRCAQQRVEHAERLARHVLQDEKSSHEVQCLPRVGLRASDLCGRRGGTGDDLSGGTRGTVQELAGSGCCIRTVGAGMIMRGGDAHRGSSPGTGEGAAA